MKEDAYRRRLEGWEMRERGKRREYDQYEDHEAEKKEEMLRERKKIAAFLADYDDEKDDEKYYRGSVLARRIRDREREMEADERDRRKEMEEYNELRKRLQEEYPDKDPDDLIAKLNKEEEEEDKQDDEDGNVSSPSPEHAGSKQSKPLVPSLSDINLPNSIPTPPTTIIIKQPTMKAVSAAAPVAPVFGFQMRSSNAKGVRNSY